MPFKLPRAYVYAGLTLAMWATVATAFKLTLAVATVIQTLWISTLVSCIALICICAVKGQIPQLLPALKRSFKVTMAAAVLNPVAYYLILFEAYDRLPAQLAQPINITWTIVLALMAGLILKQPVRWVDYLAAHIGFLGVLIIVSQGDLNFVSSADWWGVFLAVGSTVIWAGYWTLNVVDHREPLVGMTLNFLFAMPLIGVLWSLEGSGWPPVDGWLGGAYIGLFEMSLAFYCWSLALKATDNAAKISNLIFLSPFISLQLIGWILGESIHMTTYLGLIVILLGIIWQQRWHASKNH